MITQKQRDAYRFALEDAGMPEVLAFMASENVTSHFYSSELSSKPLSSLVISGFCWDGAGEPFDFWQAVFDDCLFA